MSNLLSLSFLISELFFRGLEITNELLQTDAGGFWSKNKPFVNTHLRERVNNLTEP